MPTISQTKTVCVFFAARTRFVHVHVYIYIYIHIYIYMYIHRAIVGLNLFVLIGLDRLKYGFTWVLLWLCELCTCFILVNVCFPCSVWYIRIGLTWVLIMVRQVAKTSYMGDDLFDLSGLKHVLASFHRLREFVPTWFFRCVCVCVCGTVCVFVLYGFWHQLIRWTSILPWFHHMFS